MYLSASGMFSDCERSKSNNRIKAVKFISLKVAEPRLFLCPLSASWF